MSSRTLISVHNLVHRYESVTALKKISFELNEGEIFGLLGPNGGGKSTLFKILSTSLIPSDGKVFYRDINLLKQPDDVRKKLAIVFQHPGLDEKLTVGENLKYHGMLYGVSKRDIKERTETLLSQFDILTRVDSLVSELSGGMRRKVEIAKGLLVKPEFILMDEPGTGLDPGARESFWEIIHNVNRTSSTTFLITTHLMEEAEHCHRVGILDSGSLVTVGKPDDLKKELGSELVEIQSNDVENLAESLESEYSIKGEIINSGFYFQHEAGHRFIPKIIESYPGLVEEAAVRRPTLSDVFRHHTGKAFESSDDSSEADA